MVTSNINIVKASKSEFGKVRVIPQYVEKYISLTVARLKFIDSFQFTPKSLDSLVKTLEDAEFKYLRESVPTHQFGLIKRKGICPYDYMDSFARLDESRCILQQVVCQSVFGLEYAHAWMCSLGLRRDVTQKGVKTGNLRHTHTKKFPRYVMK